MKPGKEEGSGYYLFGRDLMSIPCFRTSFMAGLTASIGTTLLHFLFTSNPKKALKFGKYAFIGVTFPYWFYCREETYKRELEIAELQQIIGEKTDDDFLITDSLEFGSETFG